MTVNGGSGDDYFVVSGGSTSFSGLKIYGGSDDDTITLSHSVSGVLLDGGSGDDVFNVFANSTVTINGGAGTNIINVSGDGEISGLYIIDGASGTGTATLNFTGSSVNAKFVTSDTATSGFNLTNVDVVNGTSGNDTFTLTGIAAINGLTIDGGATSTADELAFSGATTFTTLTLTSSGEGTAFIVSDGTNSGKIKNINQIQFTDGINSNLTFNGPDSLAGQTVQELTVDFGTMSTVQGSSSTLTIVDKAASTDYRFTFDDEKASTTSISITDTDGTADAYEFFGGIFADAEDEDAIATALTSIKGKFTFSDGQFTIKGLDKADGGNATGVVFDSEETTNENAKTKFANNTLTFGNGSKSASIALSTVLEDISNVNKYGFEYDNINHTLVVKSS